MSEETALKILKACLPFGDRHPVMALQRDAAGMLRYTVRVRSSHFTREEMLRLETLAEAHGAELDCYASTGSVEFRFSRRFGVAG